MFYKGTKIFDKLIKSLSFLFLLSIHYIRLAHYLFIKTNLSWLITESIKALEIEISIQFSLDFANNTVLSYFFFFFLIIDLYFLIPEVIAQIFNHAAELVISIEIPAKEAKAEIEIHPVIVEPKIRKCLI